LKSSLNAMAAGASMHAPLKGADWMSPLGHGTRLVDRLLRRPMLGGAGVTPPGSALRFDGVDDRIALGQAPSLGATRFTIELWFMREGPGVATSTGSGGIVAVPLVTKGMAEADANNKDANYFLGIINDGKKRVLGADFEDTATGGNHPVIGVTPIYDNTWYHAAAAYDGVNFKIYLNDVQDGSVATTATPRSDSIQHAAIGTALGSGGLIPSGQTQGFFQGQMDEVRIWNVGRTGADIISTMGIAVAPPAAGLIGRWALDDGSGLSATDSAGANPGTLQPATGLNHPVTAATTGRTAAVIANDNTWHHVAATYDGGTWRLYMDGALKTTLAVGAFTPRFDSIQHAAIGTALNSTGGVGANQQ